MSWKGPGRPAVEVAWKGTWYPAEVPEEEQGRYRIHDLGDESEWDGWVGPGRVRGMKR